MKIKIIKCSLLQSWYEDRIGEIFYVVPTVVDSQSLCVPQTNNFILKKDCKIIESELSIFEKIVLLKKMRDLISKNPQGFCSAIATASHHKYVIQDISELMKYKPQVTYGSGYWFDPLDSETRLKILDTIINNNIITEDFLREFFKSKGIEAEDILEKCFNKNVDLSGFTDFRNKDVCIELGIGNEEFKENTYLYISNGNRNIKWKLVESPLNKNDYILIAEKGILGTDSL